MLKRIGNFLIAILVFVVAVVTVLVFQTVVINICMFAGLGPKESTPITLVAGHVGLILVFGLWYAFGLKKFRHARKSMKKVATPGNLGGLLLLSLGLSFFMSFGLPLVNPIIPEEIIERYIEMMEIAQLGESVFTNFAGCFLAPIGEELIFRGVMLYFLLKVIKGLKRKKVLFWVVNLVQAVAFGALHGNMYQGMYATLLGLLIGFMAYKSDTILVPILIHMIYNILQIVLMEPIEAVLPENMVIYALIVVVGFAVMIAGMCIVKFPKEEDEQEKMAA